MTLFFEGFWVLGLGFRGLGFRAMQKSEGDSQGALQYLLDLLCILTAA